MSGEGSRSREVALAWFALLYIWSPLRTWFLCCGGKDTRGLPAVKLLTGLAGGAGEEICCHPRPLELLWRWEKKGAAVGLVFCVGRRWLVCRRTNEQSGEIVTEGEGAVRGDCLGEQQIGGVLSSILKTPTQGPWGTAVFLLVRGGGKDTKGLPAAKLLTGLTGRAGEEICCRPRPLELLWRWEKKGATVGLVFCVGGRWLVCWCYFAIVVGRLLREKKALLMAERSVAEMEKVWC
uniref:Uncharacterized protein n=1 Tax=Populus alba TaxID=43335 RepID=A0A4U5PMN6_POPAL|nr:hypothetical protein D5086_0000203510 [Populus alba]